MKKKKCIKTKHHAYKIIGDVNICGNRYSVIEASQKGIHAAAYNPSPDDHYLGLAKFDLRKIYIHNSEPSNKKKETLIHEILHGISDHANLELSEKKIIIIANFLWMAGFHIDGFEFNSRGK